MISRITLSQEKDWILATHLSMQSKSELQLRCTYDVNKQWQDIQIMLQTHPSYTHTHTHLFNGPFSGTTWVSRYQKGKTNLDFTEARDSEWQWHQLGHMQVCMSLQTDSHASIPPLSFLQAGCPSCHPTNSIKALKANQVTTQPSYILCI